jgi:hypothetical protein
MSMLQPTLHKPVPLGSSVRIIETGSLNGKTGIVAGIAWQHVIFVYIIILDEPIQTKEGLTLAVTLPGTLLQSTVDGSDWKLDK